MDRLEVLRGLFDRSGLGLEIGPSYNPVARKSDGYNIEILDHVSTETLRKRYPRADIEEVDYVTGGSSMADVVPHRGKYDYIVASHVIEHQPDIIGFMKDCAALMRPAGRLVLAVPDKRHCFDFFMPISTAGHALQAHFERRKRHPPSLVFDHHAYAVSRGGNIVWNSGFSYPTTFVHQIAEALSAYSAAIGSSDYVDAHAWFFVPSSFRLLMHDLHEIGAVALREAVFIPGIGPEFYVGMSLTGAGCPDGRIELMRSASAEIRSVPP